ncbi:BTAD domain-containing putative transcriptional regulator [Nonomuraea ferruginea]
MRRLVADHPLRERLRAQLMRALYGSGRQAEALTAYAEGWRILDDQLGIQPGPELAAAHLAVLRADPALGLATLPLPSLTPHKSADHHPPFTRHPTGHTRTPDRRRSRYGGRAGTPAHRERPMGNPPHQHPSRSERRRAPRAQYGGHAGSPARWKRPLGDLPCQHPSRHERRPPRAPPGTAYPPPTSETTAAPLSRTRAKPKAPEAAYGKPLTPASSTTEAVALTASTGPIRRVPQPTGETTSASPSWTGAEPSVVRAEPGAVGGRSRARWGGGPWESLEGSDGDSGWGGPGGRAADVGGGAPRGGSGRVGLGSRWGGAGAAEQFCGEGGRSCGRSAGSWRRPGW